MLFDLNEIDGDPFADKTYDVCIIGGGIAGIALALYLNRHINVLLLEAGGLDYSETSQDVYKGKNVGHTYFNLEDCRGRWLGGSSNFWGGRCHPLSSCDFKKRAHVAFSGWPIDKKDLDPYHDETLSILDIPSTGQAEYYEGWSDVLEKPDDYFNSMNFLFSLPPTNFKDKYVDTLKSRSNIDCYLNANLTDMTLNGDFSNIENIDVQNYRTKLFKPRATRYVLAAGGIENARLLLNFNKQCKNGIGNDNDLVGRFFSDHPHITAGHFILSDPIAAIFASAEKPSHEFYTEKILVPTEKFRNEDKILNFGLHFEPKALLFDPSHNTFKEKIRAIVCSAQWMQNIANTIKGDAIDCFESDGKLHSISEQMPNPDSRVTLGDEIDSFGLKRTVLDWQFKDIDKYTVRREIIRFATLFARLDLGRVKIWDWVLNEDKAFPAEEKLGGRHHMGTTRMGASAKDGVVNRDQKVFGIDNLYIAGSSVFATTGHVNPTFPIIQMTLRLAEHINTLNAEKSGRPS